MRQRILRLEFAAGVGLLGALTLFGLGRSLWNQHRLPTIVVADELAATIEEALAGDDPEEALRVMKLSLEFDTRVNETILRANMGRIYVETSRPEEALPHLARAVELSPEDATSLYYLATAYEQLGRLDAAAEAARQACERNPRSARAQFRRGSVDQARGEFDAALRHLHQAVTIREDHAAAWKKIAEVLDDLGRTAEAVRAYERLQALRPGDEAVKARLEVLRTTGSSGPGG